MEQGLPIDVAVPNTVRTKRAGQINVQSGWRACWIVSRLLPPNGFVAHVPALVQLLSRDSGRQMAFKG